MEKDLLKSVITVEQEIRDHIEQERNKATAWLEEVEADCRRLREKTERELREELRRARETACSEAAARAEQEVSAAERLARRLDSLADERLREILASRLDAILPLKTGEPADDR